MIRVVCLTAAIAAVAAGCYNYQPAALTPTPAPDAYLAITLTDSGARALAAYLGPDARAVRGRHPSVDDAGLHLAVETVQTNRGEELTWRGETVTIPQSFIGSVSVRQFSKGKTITLAGIGVAAIVGVAAGFELAGKADSPGQGGGGPNPH
jgi:hypothetical protein